MSKCYRIFNYKMPNRKKNLLTGPFLTTFKEELDNLFETSNKKQPATYSNFYGWLCATAGFYEALQKASEKHNLTNAIYHYAHRLPWYDSDMFDEELLQIMIQKNIIELGNLEDLFGGYPTEEALVELEKHKKEEWIKMATSHQGYSDANGDWIYSTPKDK